MKSNLLLPCAATIALLSGISAYAEENPRAWTPVKDPGKIVPAAKEYAVIISEKAAKDPAWRKVATTLKNRYSGTIIAWKGDIASVEEKLKKQAPRYIAVVALPEELDRVVVAKLHRMTRRIDPDFYGDAIFGIITGRSAEGAQMMIEEQKEPLLIERGLSTTNCDRERFKEHFFITDWGPYEYIETKDGVSSEKKKLENDREMAVLFAEKFEAIQPQYLVSASHATEFNLEMPFSRGLIAPSGGKFYCFGRGDMPDFVKLLGKPEAVGELAKRRKLRSIAPSPNPKIWIAAGNCLFGDVLRNKDSMVPTLISEYGLRQIVGYTIPTWYGVGWGAHGNFFNGHQDVSVGQAWFFANQAALEKLPEPLRTIDYRLNAEGMTGTSINGVSVVIHECRIPYTKDDLGRLYDRDVIAFYGDPLFRSSFDPNAKNCQPWQYTLETRGKERRVTVTGTQGKTRKSEFRFWFPQPRDPQKPITLSLVKDGKKQAFDGKFSSTKNFLMLTDAIELKPGEKLVFEYSVLRR